jgi:acyl-CoA synthetase (NDP forming)
LPTGSRVAVIGNSGGPGILAADAAAAGGLTVPQLSTEAIAALKTAAPSAASWDNPIDLGAAAQPQAVLDAIRVLAGCHEVDAVLAVFVETLVANPDEILAAIAEATTGRAKPVVVAMLADEPRSLPTSDPSTSLPLFGFPEPAARALAAVRRYAELRDRPVGAAVIPDGVQREVVRRRIEALLTKPGSDGSGRWLDAEDSADLLRLYGVALCDQRPASSAADAVTSADELGYPIALKIARGDVVHKTERGGVALNLSGSAAVAAAYDRVVSSSGDGEPNVVVQPMVPAGTELIVGAVQDPQFGPVVMLGAGGVLSDLIDDRSFRLLPLTDVDAAEMIDRLRMARLLDGFRGHPVVSRDALRDLLHRVAALVDDHPQVAELDLNPVVCTDAGVVVVDAKIRLRPATARPDALLRQLRSSHDPALTSGSSRARPGG